MAAMKRPQFSLRLLLWSVAVVAILVAVVVARVRAVQEAHRRVEIRALEWATTHPKEWSAALSLNMSKEQAVNELNRQLSNLKSQEPGTH